MILFEIVIIRYCYIAPIAHEIDATFFVVSPAQMLSKWVGEAEQNVRKLFEAAKAEETSVIFLDEIEVESPR